MNEKPLGISPQEIPAPAQPPKRIARRREYTLLALLLLFCFLLWDSLLWGNGLGLGAAAALTGIGACSWVYLHKQARRKSGYALVCGLLYLAGALALVLSAEDLRVLLLPLLAALLLVIVIERMNLRTGTGLLARVADLISVTFSIGIGRIPESWKAIFSNDGKGRRGKLGAVLAGLLCAIPALILVVPLLISSDAAFAGLVEQLDWSFLHRSFFALLFALPMALILFTLLFTSDVRRYSSGYPSMRGVAPVAVGTFLGVISAAYVLYLISQFAYFFDAFRGLLPKDYTVAQYARRGFFEVCWIVALNLIFLVLSYKLCRRQADRLPGLIRALGLFLCIFSLILVGTALSKLVLYVGSFGLTRRRIVTTVFLVFLSVVLIAAGSRLFTRRVPAVQIALVTGAALLIALCLCNVDGIVARYNVSAYRDGRLDSLDMATVCSLDNSAVPVLADLLEDPDPEIARQAARSLAARADVMGFDLQTDPANVGGMDLRRWNTVDSAARQCILDHWDQIFPELAWLKAEERNPSNR